MKQYRGAYNDEKLSGFCCLLPSNFASTLSLVAGGGNKGWQNSYCIERKTRFGHQHMNCVNKHHMNAFCDEICAVANDEKRRVDCGRTQFERDGIINRQPLGMPRTWMSDCNTKSMKVDASLSGPSNDQFQRHTYLCFLLSLRYPSKACSRSSRLVTYTKSVSWVSQVKHLKTYLRDIESRCINTTFFQAVLATDVYSEWDFIGWCSQYCEHDIWTVLERNVPSIIVTPTPPKAAE
jgi:hypothetical protein